jgi:hypothetical protein
MGGMSPSLSALMVLAGPELNRVAWGLALALATFVASIAVVTFLLVQLPATYFSRTPGRWGDRHRILRWTFLILKNFLGAVLVAVGVLMLVLPGQGILTILIGVMLLSFPGKRSLERKLISRPGVLGAINRLRARFGKPPLVLEERKGQPGACMSERANKS